MTSTPLPLTHHQAAERLQQSLDLTLREVSCIASDRVVSLHGCLPSDSLDQVAQEIAAGFEGVQVVINRVEGLGPTSWTRPCRELAAHETV